MPSTYVYQHPKYGRVLGCPCGGPPEKGDLIVETEDGEFLRCHEVCVEPAE